jgi:hypothetical protein
MRSRFVLGVLCGCLLGSTPMLAEEWAVVGARQMGMGGAGVAITRGALSTYWNPAALTPPSAPRHDTSWDLAVPLSVNTAAIGDVLGDIEDISDLVDGLGTSKIRAISSMTRTSR